MTEWIDSQGNTKDICELTTLHLQNILKFQKDRGREETLVTRAIELELYLREHEESRPLVDIIFKVLTAAINRVQYGGGNVDELCEEILNGDPQP
jgi:hypothetical protein